MLIVLLIDFCYVGALQDDVEILIKDEGIEELLGKLDTLEKAAAARSGKSMWRPSKEPAEDFQAHALPYKRQELQKLQLEVRDMERNAKELASTVVQGREHIQQLKKQLDDRQKHWEVRGNG
uniref:Uncharacterized protein n=1 Tax=Eptatretus burgeri TaxID=7764 RepID=A0A8C4X0X0_EPTBU